MKGNDDPMRYRIAQFMAGRNGTDEFARFQSIAALALILIAAVINAVASSDFWYIVGSILWFAAIAMMVWCYARVFSRDIYKRRAENSKYLAGRARVIAKLRGKKTRFDQRKDYRFFSCPSCKSVMRVPRGKGKIKIVCRKCGEAFVRKT